MKENIYIITLIQIKMKYFYYFSLSNVHTNAINFRCYFRYETPEGNSTVPLKVYHHPSEAFFYSNNRLKRLTMESIARIRNIMYNGIDYKYISMYRYGRRCVEGLSKVTDSIRQMEKWIVFQRTVFYVPCTGQSWSGVCASGASRRRIYALVTTPPHSRGMVVARQARKRLASRGVATLAQLGGPRP